MILLVEYKNLMNDLNLIKYFLNEKSPPNEYETKCLIDEFDT